MAAPGRVVLVVMDASPLVSEGVAHATRAVRFDSTGEPASAVPAYEAAADCFLRELASPSSGSAADRELLRARADPKKTGQSVYRVKIYISRTRGDFTLHIVT